MEKIIWMPCAGLKFTDPPTEMGHVGVVKTSDDDTINETDEWLSREEASDKYPEIIFSGSSTRCPSCSEIYRAAAQAALGASQS